MTTGLRATARALDISHSYLKKRADEGAVPRNADGSFDVEAVRTALKRNTDPAMVRRSPKPVTTAATSDQSEPVTTPTPGLHPALASVEMFETPGERGAVMLALLLTYEVGASAGNMVLAAGGSLKVAFAAKTFMTVAFAGLVEDQLTRLGIDPEPIRILPECMTDLDWQAHAKTYGEPYAPKQWEAWLAERNAFIEQTYGDEPTAEEA